MCEPDVMVNKYLNVSILYLSFGYNDPYRAAKVASVAANIVEGLLSVRTQNHIPTIGKQKSNLFFISSHLASPSIFLISSPPLFVQVLWGSWSVLGPKHRFFFAGDTGYCPTFQEIGRRFGPFDLAAIPIGAYQPRDVMKGQHVDPEEAVMIHKDVQAKRSVAIHWGTFALAHEFYLEPPLRLREALEKKGLTTDEFFTLNHGETRLLISEEVPSDKIV